MTWPTDLFNQIGTAQELEITTRRRDGTQRRCTPIWVVRVYDDLYIRVGYGRAAAWYRHQAVSLVIG
jgi:hypothetical protein